LIDGAKVRWQNYLSACVDLHKLLGRSPAQIAIEETFDITEPDYSVIKRGERAIADWQEAFNIRCELDRLLE
jgi:hypothetical protein